MNQKASVARFLSLLVLCLIILSAAAVMSGNQPEETKSVGGEPFLERTKELAYLKPPKLKPHQVAIARLRLREDTLRVDPMADLNLIAAVRERLKWSHLYPERVVLTLDGEDLFRFPFLLFVSEHQPMNLTTAEREKLRNFLRRGGFLFASECDAKLRLRPSIKSELLTIVPEGKWIRLPHDHTIYRVPYKVKIVPAGKGGRTFHEGVLLNGRVCLVFSQNAEECSWQSWKWMGPRCACWPPDFDYAFAFGVNLFYYSLTH
ncbi:MAG: DUF4159 domain-containing protein [Armatimonadetes bacterium]|nr:DUF4159 domain-containing protein [Armatimonadota bacterium]MDW8120769.1 DUF4159 domain-containing protein [Armatimonadota bacterium]